MKKLYQTFFYVPKYGKVQDRVMTARAVVSLSVILLCLASMAITAYAWFSYNITSDANRITSARFETNVVVLQEDGNEMPAVPLSDGSLLLELSSGKTYAVTVSLSADSTASTGFCIVSGEGIGDWHTWQLGVDGDIQRQQLSFRLQPREDIRITIRDCWGTSSGYANPNANNRIGEGQTLVFPETAPIPEQTVPSTTVPTTTVPETTVPSTTVPATSEVTYVIQDGDHLTGIAERFGVSLEELCRINSIEDPNMIYVGEVLLIPTAKE